MFSRLLVPLDHSLFAEQALGPAVALAHAARAHIDIALVHQHPALANTQQAWWHEEQVQSETRYLELLAHDLRSGHSVPVISAVLEGDVVEAICAHAERVNSDIIVMTSHGRTGLDRARLGSIADAIVRHTSVPVLVVRPVEGKGDWRDEQTSFKRILVPLDGSQQSKEILPLATELARSTGAVLTLLRVVQPVPLMTTYSALSLASASVGMSPVYPSPSEDTTATLNLVNEARQELTVVAQSLKDHGLTDVETLVVEHENVAQAIVDAVASTHSDVVTMSTHGRGLSRWLLGSVTDEVVRCIDVPVLLGRSSQLSKLKESGKLDASPAAANTPLPGQSEVM